MKTSEYIVGYCTEYGDLDVIVVKAENEYHASALVMKSKWELDIEPQDYDEQSLRSLLIAYGCQTKVIEA